jgi:hypothetical protein
MIITRSFSPRAFALLVFLALALAACGPVAAAPAATLTEAAPLVQTCSEQSQAFVAALDQHVSTWGQAAYSLLHGQDVQSALPLLRQSSQNLPALIERLRGIQDEVRRMDTPACAELVRGAAMEAMDSTIQLFDEIEAHQSDVALQQSYALAGQAWDTFGTLFAALKQQKPLRQI